MTAAGIQQISLDSAVPTMQEISDFLTAGIYEDFDDLTKTFTEYRNIGRVAVRLASISNRFIVISYGLNAPDYTMALIYDVALNRYGRLKINHRCAFSFNAPEPFGLLTYDDLMTTTIDSMGPTTYGDLFSEVRSDVMPKQNLAFLQADGSVQLVDFNIGSGYSDGTFIIGKFQHERNKTLIHQVTEVETVLSNSTFSLSLLPTLDGKNFLSAVPTVTNYLGPTNRYQAARTAGKNISLVLQGNFNLTTLILRYTVGGFR
jgi:hypothetical protein